MIINKREDLKNMWKIGEMETSISTQNLGLPSGTLSWRMYAKSYQRRVVPATGHTLKLVPYFNIVST